MDGFAVIAGIRLPAKKKIGAAMNALYKPKYAAIPQQHSERYLKEIMVYAPNVALIPKNLGNL
ncbi:MAG: hypothetical protein NUV49_00970 [Patescibacteria group bacterium]|nr:hypothetical protein [Patescibacteria group bacterium]